MTCRICLEELDLIQPCNCKGTSAWVHEACLVKWLNISGNTSCEICKFEYDYIDIEENVRVLCPKIYFSESTEGNIVVFGSGIMGYLFVVLSSVSWNVSTESLFIYGNLLPCILLLALQNSVQPYTTFFFWKCCSSAGILFAGSVEANYFYAVCECTLAVISGLYMYIRSAFLSKQTVRYINIRDKSLNEQSVQGP